jgi:hypothetical protein
VEVAVRIRSRRIRPTGFLNDGVRRVEHKVSHVVPAGLPNHLDGSMLAVSSRAREDRSWSLPRTGAAPVHLAIS